MSSIGNSVAGFMTNAHLWIVLVAGGTRLALFANRLCVQGP